MDAVCGSLGDSVSPIKELEGKKPFVIGVTGKARSGKDTLSEHLYTRLGFDCNRAAFADPVKDMLRAIGIDDIEGYKEEVHPLLGVTSRKMMQTLGTEWGREAIGGDTWINLTKEKGVAIATIPLAEAHYYLENGETKELDRDKLLRTQTPHGIAYKKLVEIHEEANQKGITNTVATCTLMTQLGYPIYFFNGAETNFKITTLDDIEIFKALLVAKKASWQK